MRRKPAFEFESLTQIRRSRKVSTPTDPSRHVRGLDPAIESVLLRCLDPDPAKRPADALAVSAAEIFRLVGVVRPTLDSRLALCRLKVDVTT